MKGVIMLSQKQEEVTITGERRHPVEIIVNEKPVRVEGPKVTGLEIKEAAIDQQVEIQLDFQLYEELGPGHTKAVGNEDTVIVHKGSEFTAIDTDDNS
jgi:hypothetical protein